MTDRTDFETMLERRMQAYAASAVRPASAQEIVRSTIGAATLPVARTVTLNRPRRPALLIGLAAVLLLGAVAGAAIVGGLPSPPRGVFVEGPSLPGGRIVNAVALADGRVLVGVRPVEGIIPGTTTFRRICSTPCLPHLALLDPRTGAFTPTQELPRILAHESMALLPDGRVLIVNWSMDRDGGPSAALHDPHAGRFEEVGEPIEGRSWPFLVTLDDGRVLVGGGEGPEALASAELFDPTTGTFAPTGPMARPRSIGASATLLPDGRVLVIGGGPEVGGLAELFDPATGTFTPTGQMTVARGGFQSATLLPDGRVLIAGGIVPRDEDPRSVPDTTAMAEVYDPATGTFSAVGSMSASRYGHASSILDDGTVLVAGGSHDLRLDGVPVPASDAEIFDPSRGAFRPTGNLLRPRLMAATVPVDDRVLVLGNLDPSGVDDETGATTEWFE